ncbi:hypothetical protein IEQ34_003132 [Dendrobium chrysotoxum]|uniref:Uncharacterized protein n=1 Tax=Dendrobium chrysotoxum TaxID=161865 RepID=A0AAV7HIU9_DENCH|nr:hypothetical protein IEQ34_003132 [Dendrobium chrysotoxum]
MGGSLNILGVTNNGDITSVKEGLRIGDGEIVWSSTQTCDVVAGVDIILAIVFSRHILEPGIQRLTNCINNEANSPELLHIDHIAAVEQKGWLMHAIINLLKIQILELIPLGQDTDSMSSLGSFIGIPGDNHLCESSRAQWLKVNWMVPIELVHSKITLNLILCHLGIIDADRCLIAKQTFADIYGGSLPRITCVFLERKTEHSNFFSRNSVKHGGDHPVHKSALLIVIDLDDLLPVIGNLRKTIALTDDLIVNTLTIVGQDFLNSLSSLHRDCRFLDHNLIRLGHISDHAGCTLPVGKISSLPCT